MTSFGKVIEEKNAEIARLKDEIRTLNNETRAQMKRSDEQDASIDRLAMRLADLEKITALQKETIDAQGTALHLSNIGGNCLCNACTAEKGNDDEDRCKPIVNELREARRKMAREICDIIQHEWVCNLPEILYIVECVLNENYNPFGPAQKVPEPELVICSKANMTEMCGTCHHRILHELTDSCFEQGVCGGECVIPIRIKEPTAPQPSPVPTSGTGTAPEGATVSPQTRQLPSCPGSMETRTYNMTTSDGKFAYLVDISDIFLGFLNTHPAKDIGNLTLKVETLENADQYLSYRCEKIETTLKAQEDKFSAELSHLAKDTNRALYGHKQINDTAREVSNEQAVAIYKMQERIAGIEHRLSLAQDRIAEIHPSGCIPPVEKKPKSRLKCDRATKKVK